MTAITRADLAEMRDELATAFSRSRENGQIEVRLAAAKVRDRLTEILTAEPAGEAVFPGEPVEVGKPFTEAYVTRRRPADG